ncbi:MAG: protein kinase [candidate division Zixibacteria bacterium]|nr:protein kinase [candidate division Zixibacteria bacterium]MDH3939059.1 protein kinase [candidate division Zixibacteria bacterium]MDH4032499.1 protein kinase [candidate division Zixibacteria bacterium]
MNADIRQADLFRSAGLDLRDPGASISDDLIVQNPVGIGKLGITYICKHNRREEFYHVRELLPSLGTDVLDESLTKRLGELGFALAGSHLLIRRWTGGDSLLSRLVAETSIDLDDVVRMGSQMTDQLRRLHDCELVHGAVHDRNIVIDAGHFTLVDAAIPSALRERSFRILKGDIFDNKIHLAPERLRGQPFDAASDWYSLASVLWLARTGLPPYFVGDTVAKRIQDHAFDSPWLSGTDDSWLHDLLRDMLVPDPENRLTNSELVQKALTDKTYRTITVRAAPSVSHPAEDQTAAAPSNPDRKRKVVVQFKANNGSSRRLVWPIAAAILAIGNLVLFLLLWGAGDREQELAGQITELRGSFSSALSDRNNELQQQTKQSGQLEEELRRTESSAQATKDSLERAADAVRGDLERTATTNRREINRLQENLDDERRRLGLLTDSLEMIISTLSRELTTSRTNAKTLSGDLESARRTLEAKDRELTENSRQIAGLNDSLEILKSKLDEPSGNRDRLQDEIDHLRTVMDELQGKLDECRVQKENTQKDGNGGPN